MKELETEGQIMALTGAQVKAQVNAIQDVMKSVMKEGVHYGKVPGCGNKPCLLKPGAEKIMLTFQLSSEVAVEDLSETDERRYRITVKLLTRSGTLIGSGIGEASTSEEKYKWRAAICDAEYNDTMEDRRRMKWKKGYDNAPATQIKQVRTNIEDIANTVLKMAKKRALVDAVLTGTAASDCFAQDFEEMPEEIREQIAGEEEIPQKGKEKVEMPKVRTEEPTEDTTTDPGVKLISDPQKKRLFAIRSKAGWTDDDVKDFLKENYGIEHTGHITRADYDDIWKYVEKNPK